MSGGKKLLAAGLCLVLILSLGACRQNEDVSGKSEKKKKITVGCLARDEATIQWIADQLADKYGIEPQVYSETVSIMQAAAEGANDLNYVGNIPYLNSYKESYGGDLVFYKDQLQQAATYLVSQKHKKIEEIPKGGLVAVANDNSNRTRELNLLVAEGLLELNKEAKNPTPLDITANPKKLEINEIDARSRVGALPDYDAVTMPAITYYQMDQKDKDKCNILAVESDQVSIDIGGQGFMCLKENVDKEWLNDMWQVGCTKEFADWLTDTYDGALIPSGYYLQDGQIKYENPIFEVPDIY